VAPGISSRGSAPSPAVGGPGSSSQRGRETSTAPARAYALTPGRAELRVGKADGVGFPFSSRTVGVLVRSIDAGYTSATIGTLLLEAGADRWEPASWPNKQTRLQRLFASMRESSDPDVRHAAIDLATQVLRDGARPGSFHGPTTWYEDVRAAVAADGWEYDVEARRLIPTVPGVDAVEYTDAVDRALAARGWTTA